MQDENILCSDMLTIDTEAQLFFVAPFWSSVTAVGDAPETRVKALNALAADLNAHAPTDATWHLQPFEKPRTLRLRKHGQIWRRIAFQDTLVDEFRSLIGDDHFAGLYARAIYFDYGLGHIEISIGLKNLNTEYLIENAANLVAVKLALVEECVAGIPRSNIDMLSLDKEISQHLTEHHSGVDNRLRPSYDPSVVPENAAVMCGPVSRNIIMIDSCGTKPQFEVSTETLTALSHAFLNERNEDDGKTGSDRIPLSHEGFEGAVALVRRNEETLARLADPDHASCDFAASCEREDGEVQRTKMLWSVVQIYWSAMFCASEGYFAMTAEYAETDIDSLKEVMEELKRINIFQKILSMIKFESQPEKITVEGEDRIRYNAIWHAYDTEELIRALTQIQRDAENTLETLRNQAQRLLQRRMNAVLTAFTLLTLLSVVVDIIILYDVNEHIGAVTRIALLGIGASSLMALAALSLGALSFVEWAWQKWKS